MTLLGAICVAYWSVQDHWRGRGSGNDRGTVLDTARQLVHHVIR